MKKKAKKKICFICSSGGHFSELSKLESLTKSFESFLVVEKTEGFKTTFCDKVYYTREINRKEKFFALHFLVLCLREFAIFVKERPNYLITTGALCSYPMARVAKLFKCKIVYLESFARVYDLSMTGQRMYNIADLFLVQWPDLITKYPKAQYFGSLFRGE